MLLLLVRHGQSLGNIEGRIQGDDDPLSDLRPPAGEHRGGHARRAGRVDITHLYASPLDRAIETATIIGRAVRSHACPDCGFSGNQRRTRGRLCGPNGGTKTRSRHW